MLAACFVINSVRLGPNFLFTNFHKIFMCQNLRSYHWTRTQNASLHVAHTGMNRDEGTWRRICCYPSPRHIRHEGCLMSTEEADRIGFSEILTTLTWEGFEDWNKYLCFLM